MIPEEYGGSGLGPDRGVGDHGGDQPLRRQLRAPCHGQMYNMGTLLRSGSERAEAEVPAGDRRRRRCASSRWRSPSRRRGTDTTKIKTTAVRKGDRYVVNGQKVWISRVQHSDLMILLARTTPLADVEEEVRRHVGLHRRPARRDRPRPDRATDRRISSTTRPTSSSSTTSRSRPRT